MEKVTLNNVQLDHLATGDALLKPYFNAAVACDRLPRRKIKNETCGYIVNTDPHNRPGRNWLALWIHSGNVCEVIDSYALPLGSYETTEPLQDWLKRNYVFLQCTVSAIYLQ